MHFHIDIDEPLIVSGWLVPDNPGERPEFVIRIPGRKDIGFAANVLRSDLRDLGIHSTGWAGFHIDDALVPDIAELPDIAVLEAETGLLVYRRFAPDRHLAKKLLFVEGGFVPQIKMTRHLMSYFAQSYPVVERQAMETVSGLLGLNVASLFISGQVNWMRHGSSARNNGFVTACLLRDPFEELAERLLFLQHMSKQDPSRRPPQAVARYKDLLPLTADLDLADDKAILRAFRKLPMEARRMLRSPMTHLFGSAPDEELQRRNVSIALDSLSQLNVVGISDRFDDFVRMIEGYLGAPVLSSVSMTNVPGTLELADLIKNIGLVADLLDEDIALYSFVCQAVEAGLTETGAPRGTQSAAE